MPPGRPKRTYSLSALEAWLPRLACAWEEQFDRKALDSGRRIYRASEVRELEVGAQDAIVHAGTSKKSIHVVIEANGDGQLHVRASTSSRQRGDALAVAGLYEVEELIADELPDLPPESTNGHAETSPAPMPAQPEASGNGTHGAESDRTLELVVKVETEGIFLGAEFGEKGDFPRVPAFGKASQSSLSAVEREKLLRLMGWARKAGFSYISGKHGFLLTEAVAIGAFARDHWPKWRRTFRVAEADDLSPYAKPPRELRLQAIAENGPNGLRVALRAFDGESLLDEATTRKLVRAAEGESYVAGFGLARLGGDARGTAKELTGSSLADDPEQTRYRLLSLFGETAVQVQLTPELEAWRERLLTAQAAPELPETPAYLRPYQKHGANWLAQLLELDCHALLADEMGLGKTVQLIALLSKIKPITERPNLVVCPASVLPVWETEVQRFAPELKAGRLTSEHVFTDEPSPYLWLASYTQLRRHKALLGTQEFGYAILDEAQMVKNPDAKVTQACLAIRARHRIALTGTPLENRPLDLWTLFRFLMPGLLGTRSRFEELSASDSEGLIARTRRQIAPFTLRRLKSQVAKELPEKSEIPLICPLSEVQANEYRKLVEEGVTRVGNDLGKAWQEQRLPLFALLTRLRQTACDPGLLPGRRYGTEQSGKLETLADRLEEIVSSGHKAVVFSQFTSLLDRAREHLEPRLGGTPLLDLRGSTRDRGKPVSTFQNAEGPAVMLVSLKAGGTGITLHAAEYVFLLDPWWNPAVEQQAIDRVHRIGQQRPVFVFRMITRGTIEARIEELKQQKRDLFDDLVGSLTVAGATGVRDLLGLDIGPAPQKSLETLTGTPG